MAAEGITNEEMHRYMTKLEDKMDNLVKTVTPLVTDVALVKQQQDNAPKTNALWAAIGMLSGIILSLLVYISKIH